MRLPSVPAAAGGSVDACYSWSDHITQYAGQSQDTVEAKLEVATPPVRRSAVPTRLQELVCDRRTYHAPHRLVTPRMGLYACMCAHATYSATYVCMCADK